MADPYVAIRHLPFLRFDFPAIDEWRELESGREFVGRTPAQILYELATDFLAPDQREFQSKYNAAETLADGTIAVTLQQTGAHKYDTMLGIYQPQGAIERVDTRTDNVGQSVPVYKVSALLINDPMSLQTRQESSAHANWESIGTAAAVIAAAYGAGAYLGAQAGAAAGGAAATQAGATGASGIAPVSTVAIEIPAVAAAPSGGGAFTLSNVVNAARAVASVGALVNQGLNAVQAYRDTQELFDAQAHNNFDGSVSFVDESGYLVTHMPDGTVRRDFPPVGTAYALPDGRAVVNNGDGTYAIVDQLGNVIIRRYAEAPDGAGVMSALQKLTLPQWIGIGSLVALLFR